MPVTCPQCGSTDLRPSALTPTRRDCNACGAWLDGQPPVSELVGPSRWAAPSADRAPMNVHPDVRDDLARLLCRDEMRGVGYSEFIRRAVDAANADLAS